MCSVLFSFENEKMGQMRISVLGHSFQFIIPERAADKLTFLRPAFDNHFRRRKNLLIVTELSEPQISDKAKRSLFPVQQPIERNYIITLVQTQESLLTLIVLHYLIIQYASITNIRKIFTFILKLNHHNVGILPKLNECCVRHDTARPCTICFVASVSNDHGNR